VEKPKFNNNVEQRRQPADDSLPPNIERARTEVPQQSYTVPPKQGTAIVTFKQAKRFRAIARDNGYSDGEITKLLQKNGFGNSEEITRNEYDRLCLSLEDPATLAELRGGLPSEQSKRDDDDFPY
jgi:hypothetical protein